MSDDDHPDVEGRVGHEAGFVDTIGNRNVKQRLPLEVDMDPDRPREDIPNHSGALALGMLDLGRKHHHLKPPDGGKPKWFGHGLSLAPDTEMRRQPHGAAEQVVGPRAARHRQGSTMPTYLGLAQRRQRAGIRTPTGFEFGKNPGLKKNVTWTFAAQFEPNCFVTESPANNALDNRTSAGAVGIVASTAATNTSAATAPPPHTSTFGVGTIVTAATAGGGGGQGGHCSLPRQ